MSAMSMSAMSSYLPLMSKPQIVATMVFRDYAYPLYQNKLSQAAQDDMIELLKHMILSGQFLGLSPHELTERVNQIGNQFFTGESPRSY